MSDGELADGWDADPIYPLTQTRVEVDPRARVFEITAAAEWHTLALTYGTRRLASEALTPRVTPNGSLFSVRCARPCLAPPARRPTATTA